MVDIVWEAPPSARKGAGLERYAAALREKPGHWCLVAEGLNKSRTEASSFAVAVRRAKLGAFKPKGAFAAVSRGDKVYAAWIGTEGEFRALADSFLGRQSTRGDKADEVVEDDVVWTDIEVKL